MPMKKYDVTFQRADYAESVKDWELVGDVCDGQRKVKKKSTTYLPELNAADKSEEGKLRYDRYLERAHFLNFTGRTLEGLIGAVFIRHPSVTLPKPLEYMLSNVDGQGISIVQQAKSVISEVMKCGRHALYVDYPVRNQATTLKERETGAFNATIKSVSASSVVNWQVMAEGSLIKLSLVVIKESVEAATADGFGVETAEQYRVLRLLKGEYQVEVWRKGKETWEMAEGPFIPRTGTGKSWTEIPFTFVGAENNDSTIDKAPLLDLANLNIAHYRNSADYEDSVFFVGQAQPFITGLTEDWRDHLEKQGIVIGSRSPLLLPVGAVYDIAQAGPNMVAFEAMKHKEDQAKAIGARLLENGIAVKTATQATADSASEHSVLSLVVSNVEDAYHQAIEWSALFMNTGEKFAFEINKEFISHQLDPQKLTALVGAWQTGKLISKNDVWAYLRRVGVIDAEKTDDDIEGELESDDTGLGFDDEPGGTSDKTKKAVTKDSDGSDRDAA